MILYVNGAEHTSAVRARHHFEFASDDKNFIYMGDQPHPDNLELGFGRRLNKVLKTSIMNDARPYCSNARIMRTTRQYLESHHLSKEKNFLLIHWAPFDRDEFFIDDHWYQVSMRKDLNIPVSLEKKFKRWKSDYEPEAVQKFWHKEIWKFHKELEEQNIDHLFAMESEPMNMVKRKHKWGDNFLNPYDFETTMVGVTKQQINPDGHGFFQEKGHLKYMNYLVPHVIKLIG